MESGVVVRRIAMKNGIATHYCSLGTVARVQTNTINLWILSYKCIVMLQKYSASFTDIPYQAGTVNHATKNETAKITVTLYMAGTVNHAIKNEWLRLQSLRIWLVRSTMPWIMKWWRLLTLSLACDIMMRGWGGEQYHTRSNVEIAKEKKIKAWSKNNTWETSERHDIDRAATSIVAVEKAS